jgi:hypothetical protein
MNEDDAVRSFLVNAMTGNGKKMDVFTTTGSTTGRYDQLVASQVPCMIVQLDPRGFSLGDRAQVLATRELTFAYDFVMPARAQVLIEGQRWQVTNGTVRPTIGPAGGIIGQTCDLRSAQQVTS